MFLIDLFSSPRSQAPLVEVLNIGTGEGTSVLEIVASFEEVSGRRLDYSVGERRAGDIAEIYADATRSLELLGWRADRSITDALRDAWNWEQFLAEQGQRSG